MLLHVLYNLGNILSLPTGLFKNKQTKKPISSKNSYYKELNSFALEKKIYCSESRAVLNFFCSLSVQVTFHNPLFLRISTYS